MVNKYFPNKPTSKQIIIIKIKKIFSALCVFLFFFLAISYFFLPYSSIKNYLESEMEILFNQNNIPMKVKVEKLKPYWFTGLQLKTISIQNTYTKQPQPFVIEKLQIRLSVLPLFIGRANFKANINLSDGKSEFFGSMPLLSMLNGHIQNFKIKTTFENFDIGSIANQYLDGIENSTNPSLALFSNTLASTSVGGYLNGNVDVQSKNNIQTGNINLTLNKFYFFIQDPSLKIPVQHFEQAKLEFIWNENTFNINESTAFKSENIFIKPKGIIRTLNIKRRESSLLNLDLLLIVSGAIEKNFDFLIPQILKCPSTSMVDGIMNVKFMGSIEQYVCD